MIFPFSFLNRSGAGGNIVIPVDGDLTILNGQTVDIPEGSIKQFNNLIINTGGTLRITGNTGLWTEIGVAGDCVVNGQILCRAGYDGQATHNGGTFTKTSFFDLGPLSYTIVQRNGGAGSGGSSGDQTSTSRVFLNNGGPQINGVGGGGGGMDLYFPTYPPSRGAQGGSNSNGANGTFTYVRTPDAPLQPTYPTFTVGQGGAGGQFGNGQGGGVPAFTGRTGVPTAGNGGSGASGGGGGSIVQFDEKFVFDPPQYRRNYVAYGGAGGGAYKGHHGKGLVLYVEGNLSGSGSVICSGRNGFNGGGGEAQYQPEFNQYNPPYAGSGGGGAGGSGGKLILKYKTGNPPSFSVVGGAGGSGVGGIMQGTVPARQASASGQTGDNGTSDVGTI